MKKLELLTNTGVQVTKKSILRHLSDLEKQVFYYALNVYSTYGVNSFSNIEPTQEPKECMFLLLDKLECRELSGDAAKDAVNKYAAEHGGLIKMICQKRLACGVSTTTFNKVHSEFIPCFNLQLAKEVPLANCKLPLLAQLKYDGVRIAIIKQGGEVKFRTRKGHEIHLPRISKCISQMTDECFMLDTEVTLIKGRVEDRTKVSGMINSARHGNWIDESLLCFNAFDHMSPSEFFLNMCKTRFEHRLRATEKTVNSLKNQSIFNIITAETHEINTREDLQNLYDDYIADGHEGLILKPYGHLYTFKRNKNWIKMKETKSADLLCKSTTDGKGKREGMIGALMCEGKVEGKNVTVNVAGMTEAAASEDPSNYIGKTIEIKYNTIILDKVTGTYSLFLPRFTCVRFDK